MRLGVAARRNLGRAVLVVIEGHERRGHAAPVVIDEPVVGETIEIGGKARGHGITGTRPYEIHPHILEELLGRRGVAALAQEIAIQRALVPAIELVKRGRIAVAIGEHQIFVARRFVPGHPDEYARAARRGKRWRGREQ